MIKLWKWILCRVLGLHVEPKGNSSVYWKCEVCGDTFD